MQNNFVKCKNKGDLMYTLEELIKEMDIEKPTISEYVEKTKKVVWETNKVIDDSKYSRAKKLVSHGREYFSNLTFRNIGIAMMITGGIGTADIIRQYLTSNMVAPEMEFFDLLSILILDPFGPMYCWTGISKSKEAKTAYVSELGEETLTKKDLEKLEFEVKKYEELYNVDNP